MATHDHSEITSDRDPSRDKPSRRSWWVFGGFGVLSLILLAVEHLQRLGQQVRDGAGGRAR